MEGVGQLKNPVTSTGIEPSAFRACSVVASCTANMLISYLIGIIPM
jgi:hypothetical protein